MLVRGISMKSNPKVILPTLFVDDSVLSPKECGSTISVLCIY